MGVASAGSLTTWIPFILAGIASYMRKPSKQGQEDTLNNVESERLNYHIVTAYTNLHERHHQAEVFSVYILGVLKPDILNIA